MSGRGSPASPRPAVRAARRLGGGLCVLLALAWGDAGAQGSCSVNNRASCQVGNDAATAINLTISRVALIAIDAPTVLLGTATATDFQAGFGPVVTVPITIRANVPWSVAIRALSGQWTATPGSAWQAKPSTNLGWALVVSGPFTGMTTTAVTIGTGSATAGSVIPLRLRPSYAFVSDAPGSYSLPLQLTLSAP